MMECMQLTYFTDYGLRILMYLTVHQEKRSTVRELSEYYGISRNHLVKVVYRLSQLGLIESSKGKGGGIRLASNAQNARLGDVVKQLETNMDLVECFNCKTNSCHIVKTCQLKHYIHEAGESFINTLNKYTLEDTVRNKLFLK